MIHTEITERAAMAVTRYGHFLDIARNQVFNGLSRDPLSETARMNAVADARAAAGAFLSFEHAVINEDTADIARMASQQARSDIGLGPAPIEDRFAEFIFNAASWAIEKVRAQTARDVATVADSLREGAQRIDLYMRSGRYSLVAAVAQVTKDTSTPGFRFTDRLGRNFKPSKHVRDTYRLHLLNTYNEVYMDVIAAHGGELVAVTHPDPNYRWYGEVLAIVPGHKDVPLFYDVRDEIFHPGSDATLTRWSNGSVST